MTHQPRAFPNERRIACVGLAFMAVALVTAACGPGDDEPCSQIHDGDLVVCTHDCLDTAVSDADVESLRNIRVVTGSFTIVRTNFVDLGAFECLEEVGKDVAVGDNSELVTLAGLGQLRHIGRNVEDARDSRGIAIDSNPRLESLDGLTSLREILTLHVYDNETLRSLSLSHVEHIGELYLGFCGTIIAVSEAWGNNPSLTALDGFASLASLELLSVSGQSGLTSLDRLRELAERGVAFYTTDFHFNERLDIAEIEAFMDAAGATGTVCENAGDDTVCMCPGSD